MNRRTELFRADWLSAAFVHFKVSAEKLQPIIPFALDIWQGDAYLSLVAFTQSRLRPAGTGRIGQWLSSPLGHHEFLNLRTYVKSGNQRGIYFISEWIPNRLAILIGPRMYGLPYRLGRLRYRISPRKGRIQIDVAERQDRFAYTATLDPNRPFVHAEPATLDHFLLERYIAFTSHHGVGRRFEVAHDPWQIKPIHAQVSDMSLLKHALPNFSSAQPVLGHYSLGAFDVSISPPQKQTYGFESGIIEGIRSGSPFVCPKPMLIHPS